MWFIVLNGGPMSGQRFNPTNILKRFPYKRISQIWLTVILSFTVFLQKNTQFIISRNNIKCSNVSYARSRWLYVRIPWIFFIRILYSIFNHLPNRWITKCYICFFVTSSVLIPFGPHRLLQKSVFPNCCW